MFWLSDVYQLPGTENGRQLPRYGVQRRGRTARANVLRHAARGLFDLSAAARRGLVSWIQGRHNRRRALRDLNYLDDHLLADIGLTRSDVDLLHRGKWPTRYADDLQESTTSVVAGTHDRSADTGDDQQDTDWQRAA